MPALSEKPKFITQRHYLATSVQQPHSQNIQTVTHNYASSLSLLRIVSQTIACKSSISTN